jgi:UDP-glucuronate 4-epimerase
MERDFTFVEDIVESIFRLIHSEKFALRPQDNHELLNIGYGSPIQIGRLVELIEHYLGKKAVINLKPMQEGDMQATWANVAKLEGLVGYKPIHSLEAGLKKTVDWYLRLKKA